MRRNIVRIDRRLMTSNAPRRLSFLHRLPLSSDTPETALPPVLPAWDCLSTSRAPHSCWGRVWRGVPPAFFFSRASAMAARESSRSVASTSGLRGARAPVAAARAPPACCCAGAAQTPGGALGCAAAGGRDPQGSRGGGTGQLVEEPPACEPGPPMKGRPLCDSPATEPSFPWFSASLPRLRAFSLSRGSMRQTSSLKGILLSASLCRLSKRTGLLGCGMWQKPQSRPFAQLPIAK
mmetsp:Transcript_53815/g.149365  ORF Transcript_53815/g.149365 Transcript_53815/m.149365 type:complete len:236 (-) Transcript_53815:1406-2113(-)